MFRRHTLLDGKAMVYAAPPGQHMGHPHFGRVPFNIGDIFVTEALGRILELDEILVFDHRADPAVFELMNETCRAVVFIAQNALRPGGFEFALSPALLDRIRIPIVLLSLGVQSSSGTLPELTQGDITSLKMIHERAAASQLRGEAAAELLARHGIHNTEVLGCPSILWSVRREISVRPPSLGRVGWTLTHNPGSIDAGEGAGNLQQESWLSAVAEVAEQLVPIAQGGEYVLQDHILVRDGISGFDRRDVALEKRETGLEEVPFTGYGDLAGRPTALLCRLARKDPPKTAGSVRWSYRNASPRAVDALLHHSFFSHRLADYMANARGLGLMLGTRLHGNIMALSQGVPTAFAVHDARVAEVAAVLRAPMFDFSAEPRTDHLLDLDWAPFERRYTELHDGFAAFFDRCGLPHRLQPAAAAVAQAEPA
jgi:hypothetical protein